MSLVRNNIIDTGESVHLGPIDEDGELCLLDDLGAEHEESSDEDEILIVDKKRYIGDAFQSQSPFNSRQIPDDFDDEDGF